MKIKTGKKNKKIISLPKILGVKVVAGVKLIVPLTRISIRKGHTIYQREVTR